MVYFCDGKKKGRTQCYLGLGRRLFSLLPLAQWTNEPLTATTADHGIWVASSNLSTLHNMSLFRKVGLPQVEPEKCSPLVPRNWSCELVTRRPVYPVWT